MSENSKVESTNHTFSPWEGCQKIGPGCDHCYAKTRNGRSGATLSTPHFGQHQPFLGGFGV